MQNKIDIKNNPLVLKSRDFVNNIPYKMSTTASKYVALAIANVDKKDKSGDFKHHSSSAKELKELLGVDINPRVLNGLIDELASFYVTFASRDGKITNASIFDYITYDVSDYTLKSKLGSKMRELVLDFHDGYLKYNIDNILRLNSSYLIRLYEICKDKLDCSHHARKAITFTLDIEELRKLLKIDKKNSKGSYVYKYGQLKTRIFTPAIKQFKERTDIEIEILREIKESRKVVALEIRVTRTKEAPKKKERHPNFLPHLAFKEAFLNSVTLYPDEIR